VKILYNCRCLEKNACVSGKKWYQDGSLKEILETDRYGNKRFCSWNKHGILDNLEFFGNKSRSKYRVIIENNTISRGFLKNELKKGYWTYYYSNGSIKSRGFYKNYNLKERGAVSSYRDGMWTDYYKNGSLKSESFYKYYLILRNNYYHSGKSAQPCLKFLYKNRQLRFDKSKIYNNSDELINHEERRNGIGVIRMLGGNIKHIQFLHEIEDFNK
jgi:antitoxin component YwqK of YwqJK toxin-antitoxin module